MIGSKRDGLPKRKEPATSLASHYEPSPRELEALTVQLKLMEVHHPAPALKVGRGKGKCGVSVDHPHPGLGALHLMKAMGTTEIAFANGLIGQIITSVTNGSETDEGDLNFAVSTIAGMDPKDHLEAMLLAQMTAVHAAAMTFARRLRNAETLLQQESAERGLNKLARTYAAQVEAFKRYRTGGAQRVTVEHVTVNQGGQAIVDNVAPGGRGEVPKSEPTS